VGSDGKHDGAGADGISTAAAGAEAASSTSGPGEQSVRVKVQRDQGKLYVDVDVKDSGPFPPHGLFEDSRPTFRADEGEKDGVGGTTGPMMSAGRWRTRTGKGLDQQGEEGALGAMHGKQSVHAKLSASSGSGDGVHNMGNAACDSLAAKHRGDGHAGYECTMSVGEPERHGSGKGSQFRINPTLNPMSDEGKRKCAMEPWELQRFQVPPSLRSDKWDLSMEEYGWCIKMHGKPRKRTFHPLHRSTPFMTTGIEATRYTVVFSANGARRVVRDDWPDSNNVLLDEPGPWRGYTFFQKKDIVAGETASWEVVGGKSTFSDGSYEEVDEP